MKSFNTKPLLLLSLIHIFIPQPAGADAPEESGLFDIDSFSTSLALWEATHEFRLFSPDSSHGINLRLFFHRLGDVADSKGLLGKSQNRLKIGARTGIYLADGEPANDMIFQGVYGSYMLAPDWYLGVAADFLGFDFEQPYKILGLNSTLENDASVSNTIISVWIEREFSQDFEEWKPFTLAGMGFGIVDVDHVQGDIAGGGTYYITTDVGTEFIPFVGGGLRNRFNKRFEAEVGVRAQYHIGGWDVKDHNSGLTGSVDDYFAYGVYAGLIFRF